MDSVIIEWDWKGSINVEDLNNAINKDWETRPKVFEIDTGEDCYAIVMGESTMTQEEAEAVWRQGYED